MCCTRQSFQHLVSKLQWCNDTDTKIGAVTKKDCQEAMEMFYEYQNKQLPEVSAACHRHVVFGAQKQIWSCWPFTVDRFQEA
mgnify:CR=1 FL=1